MDRTITGGCACGAIRYESHAEIEFSFNCHCRKCQRATGTGHSSAFAVPVAETTITGTIKEYEAGSDNGAKTYAGFCEKCGSPVSSRTARFPERLYLHAATLDDPTIFHPKFIVYNEVAQPWDPPAHDLIDGAASP